MVVFSPYPRHELRLLRPCLSFSRYTGHRGQTPWRVYGLAVLMAVSGLFFVASQTAAQAEDAAAKADLVARLLAAAEADLEARRLTSPKGNNAWDKYQRVLALEPTNAQAVAGMERVTERYAELFAAALEQEEYEQAAGYLAKVRALQPHSPLVAEGERRLAEAQQPQAERQAEPEHQHQAQREQERQAELERERRKQQEQDRQDELERRRQAELARAHAAELERQRQAERERREAEAQRLVGEMVAISAGSFRMGDLSGEGYEAEKPAHNVALPPFKMGRHEVTFAQWDACVADGGCGGYRPDDEGWGRGNRPVVNVSWDDAQLFIQWLNGKTGGGYRLPAESEWEYAARAGSVTQYSWGDDVGSNQANCCECGSVWDDRQTAPVGSFAANVWGLHDIHGNVWEWVQDCWHDSYEGAPADGSVRESGNCGRRVIRGGAWHLYAGVSRSASRNAAARAHRNSGQGFRLARDP